MERAILKCILQILYYQMSAGECPLTNFHTCGTALFLSAKKIELQFHFQPTGIEAVSYKMISIDNQPFMPEYASFSPPEFLKGIPFICLPPRIHETGVSWYQGINQPWESAMINT